MLYDWDELYGRHFPKDTDASSRHVQQIAEMFQVKGSRPRILLAEAGFEPEQWAESMEATVKELWELRAQIRQQDKGE